MRIFGIINIVDGVSLILYSFIGLIVKMDFVNGSLFLTFLPFFIAGIISILMGYGFYNDSKRLKNIEDMCFLIMGKLVKDSSTDDSQKVKETEHASMKIDSTNLNVKYCKHCGGKLDATGYCFACGNKDNDR